MAARQLYLYAPAGEGQGKLRFSVFLPSFPPPPFKPEKLPQLWQYEEQKNPRKRVLTQPSYRQAQSIGMLHDPLLFRAVDLQSIEWLERIADQDPKP